MKLFQVALVVAGISFFAVSNSGNATGNQPVEQTKFEVPEDLSRGKFSIEDLVELREAGIQLGQDISYAASPPVSLVPSDLESIY